MRAALANVMRTTRCVLEVDFAPKIGCHGRSFETVGYGRGYGQPFLINKRLTRVSKLITAKKSRAYSSVPNRTYRVRQKSEATNSWP